MSEQNIEPQIILGNLAVHANENAPEVYGDGSVEVEGTLYADRVVRYQSLGTGIDIEGTKFADNKILVAKTVVAVPSSAPLDSAVVWYDNVTKRLRQVNDAGHVTQVVQSKADLITHDGTQEVLFSKGVAPDGSILALNNSTASGLVWSPAPNFASVSDYSYIQDTTVSNTNALVYVTKTTLTKVIASSGLYRLSVTYNWSLNASDRLYSARVIRNASAVVYEQISLSSGVGSMQASVKDVASSQAVLNLTAGTHNFALQWKTNDDKVTAYIGPVLMEIWRVS